MSTADPRVEAFYARPVQEVAAALLGCTLAHAGCSGRIVEVESYHQEEPACHAFGGQTPRTAVLFGAPGLAYVYRSYGIHALINAVAEADGVGAAVLIRALEPIEGIEEMRARRARISSMPSIGSSARIRTAAPTPSASATAFMSAWMP